MSGEDGTTGKKKRPEREGVISRTGQRPTETRSAEELRDRRSQNMIAIGVVSILISAIALGNGATVGLLLALLGVGLLVGGLVIRP